MNGYAWGILTLPIALAALAALAGLAWLGMWVVGKVADRAYRMITDDTTDAGRPVTKAMLRRSHWYRSNSASDIVTAHRVWRIWFGPNARAYLVTGPSHDDVHHDLAYEVKRAVTEIEEAHYHPEAAV